MYTNKDFILKRRQKDFIIQNLSDADVDLVMNEFTKKFVGQEENDGEREWLEQRCIDLCKERNLVIPSEEELEKLELAKS